MMRQAMYHGLNQPNYMQQQQQQQQPIVAGGLPFQNAAGL